MQGKNKEEKAPEYYKVEVKALVPSTIVYRVFAKTADEAADRVLKGMEAPVGPPKFNINLSIKKEMKIFKWGMSIVELLKRF